MENMTGLLKIRVKRGIDLAVRDILSSDPYVVISMANQAVYDKDMLTADDKMGEAKMDIKPYMDVVEMRLENLPTPTTIARMQPSRDNYLADESSIVWEDGRIYQDMVLGLRNVERGKVEVQLEWIGVSDSSRRP